MRNSEIIKKYGKKYGFDWSKSTGVINRAASMGLSYFDKFKLADDVKNGDKNAIALQDAIIKQAKKELADSIRNIKRRRAPGDTITQQYTDRAKPHKYWKFKISLENLQIKRSGKHLDNGLQ